MGKLFNFVSGYNKNGKGVTKKQVEFDKKLGFGFFFRLIKMRLGKFSATNLIFALCNIFIFVALFGRAGILDGYVPAASNPLYAHISAVAKNDMSPAISSLYTTYCGSADFRVVSEASQALMNTVYVLILTFRSHLPLLLSLVSISSPNPINTISKIFSDPAASLLVHS